MCACVCVRARGIACMPVRACVRARACVRGGPYKTRAPDRPGRDTASRNRAAAFKPSCYRPIRRRRVTVYRWGRRTPRTRSSSAAQVRMLLANQAALEVDAEVRGHAPARFQASATVPCLCNARGQCFVQGQGEARAMWWVGSYGLWQLMPTVEAEMQVTACRPVLEPGLPSVTRPWPHCRPLLSAACHRWARRGGCVEPQRPPRLRCAARYTRHVACCMPHAVCSSPSGRSACRLCGPLSSRRALPA